MRCIDADKALLPYETLHDIDIVSVGLVKQNIVDTPTEKVLSIPQNATNGDIIKALFPDSPRVHKIIQDNFYTWWRTDYEER